MTARRLPPLAFPFALLGVLLAHLTMTVLQTATLDEGAHWIGLGVSAGMGVLTGVLVPRVRRIPFVPPLLVVIAGALVGAIMQLVLLLREPPNRSYMLSTDLSTREPVAWVLAGAPVGAIPAVLLVGAYLITTRLYATGLHRDGSPLHVPAEDGWERIMAPFASAVAVVGGLACVLSTGSLRLVADAIVLLAIVASLEIFLRDRARARWLHDVLAGRAPGYEVVPSSPGTAHVPLAVGTAPVHAVVVRVVDDARYRSAAREPVVQIAGTWDTATAPLRRRGQYLLVTQSLGLLLLLLPLLAPPAAAPDDGMADRNMTL